MTNPLMWGGAGSVVDMGPLTGRFADNEQAGRDEVRFRRLIVRLVDELMLEGMASERAISIARAFARSLRQEDGRST
jgi:hypothetical protein